MHLSIRLLLCFIFIMLIDARLRPPMPHGRPINYQLTTILRCFSRHPTTTHIALWEDDSIPFYRRDALIDWKTYHLGSFYEERATAVDLKGLLLDQPWDSITEPYLYIQTNCTHGFYMQEFCLELDVVYREDGINNYHDIPDLFGPDFEGLEDFLKPCDYFQDRLENDFDDLVLRIVEASPFQTDHRLSSIDSEQSTCSIVTDKQSFQPTHMPLGLETGGKIVKQKLQNNANRVGFLMSRTKSMCGLNKKKKLFRMRTFAVFALLAVAANAQIETATPEPAVVKRQVETQTEIIPLVHVEFVNSSEEKREKRDTEPDTAPETGVKPDEETIVKRQVDPAIISEDEKTDEHKIVRRGTDTETDTELDNDNEANPDEENIVKREIVEIVPTEEESAEENIVKRDTDADTVTGVEDEQNEENNDEENTVEPAADSETDVDEEATEENTVEPENDDDTNAEADEETAEENTVEPSIDDDTIVEADEETPEENTVEPTTDSEASTAPENEEETAEDNIVKRETGTEPVALPEETDEETAEHTIVKRSITPENKPETEETPVVEGEVTRKKRHYEHAYPDCSCLHKYSKLPLYTKLHAHCSYPGKPHPPTCAHPPCHRPHPPCNTCGHNHGPKTPCHGHGHGSGSVCHHHHVHVVPHAPVHRVHHDVHHHFIPKRPHYRAPCDRANHYDSDIYKH